MQEYIQIHSQDNVAVALQPLSAGLTAVVPAGSVTLTQDIPQGHKFALKDIAAGEAVVKYGFPIGRAKEDITAGQWVHVHNVKTGLGEVLDYTYHPVHPVVKPTEKATFMGYRRKNGRAGVRNEVWIIPTVGCVNSVARELEKRAQKYKAGSIDAIVAFTHNYGCSQMDDDQENTRRILADLIRHPNAGAVLVLGLGCENSNIPVLQPYIGEWDEERVRFLVCQDYEDELAEGEKVLAELAAIAAKDEREPIDASELIVGLKCGGSDGLSGITANPTVGAFSDLLVSKGGTTILTEVPEMFGAETLLMDRAKDEATFEKTVKLINDFKDYFTSHNAVIYENPSPGNKNGGITTLEDKSLGCTQKSGSAPVVDVLAYSQQVTEKGLNLLSAPGNDIVASTALAAAGAQIVLFTTGRGTPFASPVPTVKIASNKRLAGFKHGWIDFNAGTMVDEGDPVQLGQKLFDLVLEVASGKYVRAEEEGYHDFAIFKQGVTL